jgi:hypothetical protein
MLGPSKMASDEASQSLVAAEEAGPKKATRKLVRRDTMKQVKKKMADHFSDFTDTQKHVVLSGGLTLEKTLERDVRSNRAGNGPNMTASYYTQKRKEFALQSSPMVQLAATNPNEEVRADLREAMRSVKGRPPNRHPMITWLKASCYKTNRECVGIGKTLLEQNASKSVEQRDLLLQGMSWFQTNEVYKKD